MYNSRSFSVTRLIPWAVVLGLLTSWGRKDAWSCGFPILLLRNLPLADIAIPYSLGFEWNQGDPTKLEYIP